MIKKARKIEAVYEESLFCDYCGTELEMERSSIALAKGTKSMPTLVCPNCGKREQMRPEMMPRQVVKAGEWVPVDEIPDLYEVEEDFKNEIESAKEQINSVSSIILD